MIDRIAKEMRKVQIRFLGASFLLLVAMIFLSIIWNRSIKEELAAQATSFVRKGMISTDMRGVSESLNGIQLSSFESVTLFHQNGQRIVTLPPIFDYKEKKNSFWHSTYYDTVSTDIFLEKENSDKIGSLVFSYYRFELVRYAILTWMVAAIALWLLLNPSTRKIEAQIQKEIKVRNAEAIEEVAKKIRHNIRSPLAVLKVLFLDSRIDKEDFLEQGQSAVHRLEEIVSEIKADFQKLPRKENTPPAIYEVSKMVERIVQEKQVISKGVNISLETDPTNFPIYSELPGSDIKSTLSNLIDNSLQAMRGEGEIKVRLSADEYLISLEVSDTGKGIPAAFVQSIFDKGFTYGKEGGTGLGLYYAKKLVEDHQGNIDLESEEGVGSMIKLHFPRKATPGWHIDQLELDQVKQVVVCDDVPGIRMAWEMRFKGLQAPPQTAFYSSCEDIPQNQGKTLYLVDYDLGDNRLTGLDFAKRLANPTQFVLVTGNFDAPEVQEACSNLGCKLLSKDEISQIKIS